ncbi:MAG: thermonuclease family protein [Planctomycetota bacterium]
MCLVILPILSITNAETPASQKAPPYPVKDLKGQSAYKVSRVIDGDTVDIIANSQAVRVRLIGVDTPEAVHPQKQVEFYGKEASNFLANLLKGEEVYLEYDTDKLEYDKYGRLLAYLYRAPDGLFVNLEIIRQGYGHAYTKYPFQYMELFRAYEKRARENGKGLWAAIPSEQPPAVKDEPSAGKEEQKEVTVYITKTGKKYHRSDCEWLYASRIAITLKEAKEKGYGACKVCSPQE